MTIRDVTWGGVHWQVDEPILPDRVPSDWNFWDHWEAGEFEPDTLETIDRLVKPGSTFLDCGAWLGNVSMWAARLNAHVIAVEPDPIAAVFLRTNIDANFPNRIEVFEGAVNSYTGTCHLLEHPQGWGSSMTRLGDEGLEVPCLTLPDLFDLFDITDCSLVKMDIEGGEAEVLENGAPFLAGLGIPLLVGMHQPWWSRQVEQSWFSGYSEVVGTIGAWNQVLALP